MVVVPLGKHLRKGKTLPTVGREGGKGVRNNPVNAEVSEEGEVLLAPEAEELKGKSDRQKRKTCLYKDIIRSSLHWEKSLYVSTF